MARNFNGSTQWATNAGAPVQQQPLTIACWFKATDLTTEQILCGVGMGATVTGHYLGIDGSEAGDPVMARSRTGAGANMAYSTTGYSSGVWHHACAVFASATDRRAFIDGGSKGTSATSRDPSSVSPYIEVAAAVDHGTREFTGDMAELAIWNVALDDDEVAALGKGVSPLLVRPTALVFYAPMLGRHSPEPDFRGGYDLTLTASPAQATHPTGLYYPRGLHVPMAQIRNEAARASLFGLRARMPDDARPGVREHAAQLYQPQTWFHILPGTVADPLPPNSSILQLYARMPDDDRPGVQEFFARAHQPEVWRRLFPGPLPPNPAILQLYARIPDDERPGIQTFTPDLVNPAAWRTRFYLTARGSYRIANTAEYRFYRKQNTPPVLGVDAPFDTNATLPHEPPDTYADGIWYVGVTYFNGYVESDFLFLIRQDVDSGSGLTAPPSAPTQWRLELRPGGVVRIHALYWPIPDGARAANTWALWYTVDGSAPDPADPADATQAMTFAAGADVLIYDLPAQANGTTVKVLLRTRRSSDSTDSENAAVLTATADALGPTAPKGADTWRGRVPEGL